MARLLNVFPDKKKQTKNGWNWNVTEPSRKKKGAVNVLYTAQGYDTKAIALRRARAHNKTLKVPLLINVKG